ncbi:MAG: hypothetical protein KGJ59_09825 [Bacteroidota bacterium]|nr:hypothetical protein [Bacteroidota bacterium]
MKNILKAGIAVVVLASAMTVAGCSSSPSDGELAQLESLKSEVASLEKAVDAKKAEKADLEKQIAAKQAELAQAQKDQDATRERLKSQQ